LPFQRGGKCGVFAVCALGKLKVAVIPSAMFAKPSTVLSEVLEKEKICKFMDFALGK